MAVAGTNLETHQATPEQIALLSARRADPENGFDELKNQQGFEAGARDTARAARCATSRGPRISGARLEVSFRQQMSGSL